MTWRNMRCLGLLVLCSFLSVHCFCQDVSQQSDTQTLTLEDYSYSIKQKLLDLRKNSAIVTEQLKTLSENLEQSQAEVQVWKEQSTSLSSSLTSINEELTSSYKTITLYEHKLKTRTKLVTALLIICFIRVAGMLLGYFLYWKGIKLPRWLDILL